MFGRNKHDDQAPEGTEQDLARTAGQDGVSLVAHEERLVADAQKQVTGHVRVSKRTVTEERTVTVKLTREELVVEHLDANGAVVTTETGHEASTQAPRRFFRRGSHPLHELVLYGEDVEIVRRRRPLERVKVYVDAITDEQTFTDDVRREVIEVDDADLRRDGVATGAADEPVAPTTPGKAAGNRR